EGDVSNIGRRNVDGHGKPLPDPYWDLGEEKSLPRKTRDPCIQVVVLGRQEEFSKIPLVLELFQLRVMVLSLPAGHEDVTEPTALRHSKRRSFSIMVPKPIK